MKNNHETHLDLSACRELVRAMATLIKNTIHHYWLSRSDADHAITHCYHQLDAILDQSHELTFIILEKKLIINKHSLDEPGVAYLAMIDHFIESEIENFTITKGVSLDEFTQFMQVLSSSSHAMNAGGGFTAVMAERHFLHIITRKVILKEVAEFEVVVDRSEVGGSGGSTGPQEAATILAFLKGDVSSPSQDEADRIGKLASDSQKMAELILQAASVRQADKTHDDQEMLMDFVVGCLRRTRDAMFASKAAHTKVGKRKTTKNLLLLEEQVLRHMRERAAECTPKDLACMTESVEKLTTELEIDLLTEEYALNRHASEKSEEHLVQYLKTKGLKSVSDIGTSEKLSRDGIGIQGWKELLLKAGGNEESSPGTTRPGPGPTAAASPVAPGPNTPPLEVLFESISHLETLLDSMERDFEKNDDLVRKQNVEKLLHAFRDVNVAVQEIVADAGKRIRELMISVTEDGEPVRIMEQNARRAGHAPKHSHGDILGAFASIMHQMSEPLALVDSSLEMILSKTMGGVSLPQNTLLTLARDNVGKISGLLKDLEALGAPLSGK